MSTPFARSRTVRREDTDQFGHVNNLVWLRFTLELATAHSDAVGWDEARYRSAGVVWIVHRHEIDYHRPALPGDVLLEETWIAEMRGARCRRGYRFSREGKSFVEAETTWVLTRTVSGRPCRVTAELLAAFPVLGGGHSRHATHAR